MSGTPVIKQVKEAFLSSRNTAILRCAEIMVDSNRKDVAKEILKVTHIDKNKLAELRNRSSGT